MKKLIIYIQLLSITFLTTSCFKSFDEMQVNPNYPEEVNPGNLFANATYSRVGGLYGVQGKDFNMTASGLWGQNYAKIQYIDEDWYEYRADAIDEYWKHSYAGSENTGGAGLYDLELALMRTIEIEEELRSNPESTEKQILDIQAMRGAILVMRTYFFSIITDMWGDIPYSEALKTKALGYEYTITQPKYDAQKEIYQDFFKRLQEANDLLALGGSVEKSADMIYGGDALKWRKFANSLAARLFIHISKIDQGTASEGLNLIFSNPTKYPVFTTIEDDAMMTYAGSQPYEHPFFNNYVREKRDDFAISYTMVEMLKERKDNRLYLYSTPTPNSVTKFLESGDSQDLVYEGQENGKPRGESFQIGDRSRIGVLYRVTPNSVSHLMSYSELEFIKAEAAALLGVGAAGDAKIAYENGIRASFERQYQLANVHGVTTAMFVDQSTAVLISEKSILNEEGEPVEISLTNLDAHITQTLSQPNVSWDVSKAQQLIAEQKYISMFTNGPETFTEVRRSGYPKLTFVRGGTTYTDNGLPYRFPYAISEQTTNGANWAEAAIGIEQTMWGKLVWWNTQTFNNYQVLSLEN